MPPTSGSQDSNVFLPTSLPNTRPRRSAGQTPSTHDPEQYLKHVSSATNTTMHRSMTPSDSATQLKFTKTGRVSKATKGERVHGCDECGKVYTRAEHLRRHKKNHNPGSLLCDVPGCGRSFYREDLLLRHKQRHTESGASPYRDSSVDEYQGDHYRHHSSASQYMPGVTNSSLLAPESAYRRASSALPSNSKQGFDPLPLTDLSRTSSFNPKGYSGYMPFDHSSRRATINGTTTTYETSFGNYHWDPPTPPSYQYSSSNIEVSPRQPYYQGHDAYYRHASDASMVELHSYPQASRSPQSANSALPVLPASEEVWHANFANIGTPTSDASQGAPHIKFQQVEGFDRVNALTSPEERDFMEQTDLLTPTGGVIVPDLGQGVNLTTFVEQRYFAAYWKAFHPSWPVVHRSSFSMTHASPLLRSAMIALGAQSTGDVSDLSNGRLLHERCLKVLRKRTNNNWHTYRIADMQAIFLIELYSQFKSRRPPLLMSRCFEEICRLLANDAEAAAAVLSYDMQAEANLQRETKRRLLIACYILDQQQALFFGRQPSGWLASSGEQMAYPCASAFWDANTNMQHDLSSYGTAYEVLSAVPISTEVSLLKQDSFRSTHLITCFNETLSASAWRTVDPAAATKLLHIIDDSPRTMLAYHLALLCKLIPVRDLLAVAGESWVMAEKIASQAEYSASQQEVREWMEEKSVRAQAASAVALPHALAILDLHRQYPRTGLLAQEWAIYLACLVVWISAYMLDGVRTRERIDDFAGPSPHEMERILGNLMQAGAQAIGWSDAGAILLWTKSRLESINVPHNCGLTNGALDVLGKVVSRGHEDSWLC